MLVIGNLSSALEVPSFTHIQETSSKGYGKSDATFYAFRNYLICNPDMQLENIEPIIMNWFENNPELYKYAYSNNPFTSEKMDDTFHPIGLTCYIPDQDKKYQKDFDEYLASSDYLEDEQLFKTKRSLEIQLRNHLDKITYVDEFLILAQICNKYSEPLPSYLKSEDKQQMRSPAYGKTMGAF